MSPEDLIIEGQRKEIQETFKKEKRKVLLDEMSAELDKMLEKSKVDEETKAILEFMHSMIRQVYKNHC